MTCNIFEATLKRFTNRINTYFVIIIILNDALIIIIIIISRNNDKLYLLRISLYNGKDERESFF